MMRFAMTMTIKKLTDFSEFEALANDEIRSCTAKQGFRREKSASNIVKQMSKKYGHKYEAYKCRHCKYWHVGHARGSVKIIILSSGKKIKVLAA